MSPMVMEAPMVKEPKIPMASVKLPEDLIESARVIVAIRGGTIMDLLDGILRPTLERMETEALAARRSAARPAPPRKGGAK